MPTSFPKCVFIRDQVANETCLAYKQHTGRDSEPTSRAGQWLAFEASLLLTDHLEAPRAQSKVATDEGSQRKNAQAPAWGRVLLFRGAGKRS